MTVIKRRNSEEGWLQGKLLHVKHYPDFLHVLYCLMLATPRETNVTNPALLR